MAKPLSRSAQDETWTEMAKPLDGIKRHRIEWDSACQPLQWIMNMYKEQDFDGQTTKFAQDKKVSHCPG